jgi:hypothetical protein
MRRGTILLAIAALLFVATSASADVGPKPTAHYKFVYQIAPTSIVGGQLIECEDAACSQGKPLSEGGPQGFRCTADSCWASKYGDFQHYQKLIIQFVDRTRESNVFESDGKGGAFIVTVTEDRLSVAPAPFDRVAYLSNGLLYILTIVGLFFTLFIELPIAAVYLFLRKIPFRVVVWVILANMVTVPAVWILFPLLGFAPIVNISLAEIFAVVFEAGLIRVTNRQYVSSREALVLSLVMNVPSYLIGTFIWTAFGM